MNLEAPAGDPADPLVLLELRVARRADIIASLLDNKSLSLNLSCWLKAEEEVFGCSLALKSSLERPDGPPAPPA
jgi:hypothetical protein